MNKSAAILLLMVCMFATFADISEGLPYDNFVKRWCVGHDRACVGANGSRGNCCPGMHCQKNDPSWAEGRCYYNPGKK